jgi:hypothetical protein
LTQWLGVYWISVLYAGQCLAETLLLSAMPNPNVAQGEVLFGRRSSSAHARSVSLSPGVAVAVCVSLASRSVVKVALIVFALPVLAEAWVGGRALAFLFSHFASPPFFFLLHAVFVRFFA